MGHLQSLSSSCSKDLGLSGSKFLSKIKDLNLAFLLTNFSSLLLLLSDASFFTIYEKIGWLFMMIGITFIRLHIIFRSFI